MPLLVVWLDLLILNGVAAQSQDGAQQALNSFMEGPKISSLSQVMATATDSTAKSSISAQINSLIESFVINYQGPTDQQSFQPIPQTTDSPETSPNVIAASSVTSNLATWGSIPSDTAGAFGSIESMETITSNQQNSIALTESQRLTPMLSTTLASSSNDGEATARPAASVVEAANPHVSSDLKASGTQSERANSFLTDQAVESLASQLEAATDDSTKEFISSELDEMYSMFISNSAPEATSYSATSGQGIIDYGGAPTSTQGSLSGEPISSSINSPEITATTNDIFANPRLASLSELFLTATDTQVEESAVAAINGLYSSLVNQNQIIPTDAAASGTDSAPQPSATDQESFATTQQQVQSSIGIFSDSMNASSSGMSIATGAGVATGAAFGNSSNVNTLMPNSTEPTQAPVAFVSGVNGTSLPDGSSQPFSSFSSYAIFANSGQRLPSQIIWPLLSLISLLIVFF